jgi:hypothetical protein
VQNQAHFRVSFIAVPPPPPYDPPTYEPCPYGYAEACFYHPSTCVRPACPVAHGRACRAGRLDTVAASVALAGSAPVACGASFPQST